jgi:predicted DNA-binding transcriptional regulator AlpA
MTDRVLNANEAAAYLGISKATLASWRTTGPSTEGRFKANLPFARIGGKIGYRLSDLNAFVERNLVNR